MDKKIIVIDLDGTFLSINTFHKWMKFVFVEAVKRFHFIIVFKILGIILLRYFKLIDHSKMKFLILEISENTISKKQITFFVRSLDIYINQDILKIMNNKFNITILATAAPILYARTIKEIYKFDHLIATAHTYEHPWKENIREEKKKNLMLLLQDYSMGNKIDTVYTDHYDDLPLMRSSDLTYLVNANEKTIQLVRDENITFKIF